MSNKEINKPKWSWTVWKTPAKGHLMSCVSCVTFATNCSFFYNMLASCLCQMAHTYPTDTVNLHSEHRTDLFSVYMQACWSIPQMSIHGSKILKSGSKTESPRMNHLLFFFQFVGFRGVSIIQFWQKCIMIFIMMFSLVYNDLKHRIIVMSLP